MSGLHAQIFLFLKTRNCVFFPLSRLRKRDVSRSSRTLEAGCGGRGGVARRAALKRTAKACGPDAPTLALRFAGLAPRNDGGKRARSPGRARISRNTIAWGMPDVSGASAVNTRVHTPTTKRTRGCGCIGHPAFPAPSYFFEGRLSGTARALSAPRGCGVTFPDRHAPL